MSESYRFPSSSEHTAICGRTGSGKTLAGSFLLSESDLENRPHIALDFKGDELLNSIKEAQHIKHHKLPSKSGLYIVRFMPHQKEEMERFFWDVWGAENIHLHVDEAYMIDRNSPGFNSLLTQGRSKRISLTCLTQRPAYCSRFIFSEASHINVFHLNDIRDRKIIEGFFPDDLDVILPEFHSRWYDIKQNKIFRLLPVPDADNIRERFSERLKPKRRFL